MSHPSAPVLGYARALHGTLNRADADWVSREGAARGPLTMFRDEHVASWSGFEEVVEAWCSTPGPKTLVVPTIEHLGAGDVVRAERFTTGAARVAREPGGYLVTRRVEGRWSDLEPTLVALHHAMLARKRHR